ncbi:MAG: glycosyltransferase family 2 protein [Bryobacterales bacterium]|nr:glycosyltransferase family 2 protein [Bryobacterales bacterium]
MNRKYYVIISPVRDEVAHFRLTAESVLRQSILPLEWVIVDDGSTDGTTAIIAEYAQRYPWIRAVYRSNRGGRKPGGGVVESFNTGYKALQTKQWEFIVKLDGDLSFEPTYFEQCFAHFAAEPTLGIGGGLICNLVNGALQSEHCPAFHVRGATKIYRKLCWDSLGGLWPAPGWDTFDEVKANMLGWRTRTFQDLHLIHYRPTGSADGIWSGLVKNGRANYICGYHPLFMLAKCIRRLVKRPFVIGSVGLFYGFLTAYVRKIPRVDDESAIQYLRHQQIKRLIGQDSMWN